MAISLVYETHSISEDNERGIASGWADGPLSARGRTLARELGERRLADDIAVVFSSDLRRARETAEIAFEGTDIPVLLDWRLRECDYGDLNAHPADEHARHRATYVDRPYPGGESWRQATLRVSRCFDDLFPRWDDARVLVIGHVATRWALDHHVNGLRLEDMATSDFAWREGWEYQLQPPNNPRVTD